MSRTAIVTPYSLGAIEAYRGVIKDISEVLGDPVIDVARLFFAVMIQSGLQQFVVPDGPPTELIRSSLLADRVTTADYSKVEPVLHDIRELVLRGAKVAPLSKQDQRVLHDLASFIQDLYVAAEFKRPVATVIDKPDATVIRRLLRDDLALVVEGLLKSLHTIDVEAPVARFEMPNTDLQLFRAIVDSDVFEPYVGSQSLFEMTSRPVAGISHDVALRARAVVRDFPDVTDLRSTAIRALEAFPDILEAVGGKILGAVAKPFVAAVGNALGREQRILFYSFYPTWRQIWGGKLDKVRVLVEQERAAARSN